MTREDGTRPRVLVVEDEWLVADMIEHVLADAGYDVAGPVNSVEAAFALIDEGALGAAVLDVSLSAQRSFPIADRLSAERIPFLFMTGYAAADLPAAYRSAMILNKPMTPEALLAKLNALLA